MSQHLCHLCGSVFIGTGFVCRVCKSKGLTIESLYDIREEDTDVPVEIPDGLKVGLYVTTMNQWNITRNALMSLKNNTKYEFDTYIMDGASTDGTPDKTRRDFPWVTVLELDKPYWVSYAWNRVLEHALSKGYDYIGILNNDLLFKPGWLRLTLRCFIDDPDVGYASPVHETAKGVIRERGKNRYGHYDTTNHWEGTSVVPHVWMPGACIILRREAVEDVGMFDENYYFGDDEVDYCVRLWHNGWKVVSNLDARIVHLVSVTIAEHGGHKGGRAAELKENYGVKYINPKEYFYQKWSVSDIDCIVETIRPEQEKAGITMRTVRIW